MMKLRVLNETFPKFSEWKRIENGPPQSLKNDILLTCYFLETHTVMLVE